MNDRVALVTGAGGGLGSATCRALRERGFHVVATDRTAELLGAFAGRPGYTCAALDVTDTASALDVAQAVRVAFGRLDVLINNAGVIGYFPTVEMDPDVLVGHFQVNAFGALRTVHACLDLLVAAHGRVVNVTSESYRFRNPFQVYQTTKLTLEGLSDVMRRELAPLRVHVSTVRPGAIRTELFHAMAAIENPVPESRLAQPFGRFGRMLARRPPKRGVRAGGRRGGDRARGHRCPPATALRDQQHADAEGRGGVAGAAGRPRSRADDRLTHVAVTARGRARTRRAG